MSEFFSEWLGDRVENLGPNEKAPSLDRYQMAKCIRDSWEELDDDALRGATLVADFLGGLKFSQLLNEAYFKEQGLEHDYPHLQT